MYILDAGTLIRVLWRLLRVLETLFPIGQTEKVIAMLKEAQSAMRTLRKKQISVWQDSGKFHRGLN